MISRIQAQKHAAFYYRQALYRRTTITLDTEWEGKMLSYGSFVRVQSELPQTWGASGRIDELSRRRAYTRSRPELGAGADLYPDPDPPRCGAFGPVKVSRFGADISSHW